MPGRTPIYLLVCRAPHPDPRRAARGEIHGAQIGAATEPVRHTDRLLNWLLDIRVDGRRHYAPTCGKCGVATEYVACKPSEVDAE